jgi:transcriptional regulator with XRE-family HTH domain
MLITPHQIRAARALLDWSAEELGERVGLTKAGISRIETGRTAGSVEVLQRIVYAFQSGGVEMTDDGGVRPRQSKINVYRGHSGFCAFFDDIYEVGLTDPDPDICITNVVEAQYDRWLGSHEPIHSERMTKLKNVKLRALMKQHDVHLTSTAYCEYRWVPEARFADVSLYIYGDKVAFIEFGEHDVVVTAVDSRPVAMAQRKMFEVAWQYASKEPQG